MTSYFRIMLIALLCISLCCLPAQADLDIDTPPGTPLDWLLWRPTGIPSPDIAAVLSGDPEDIDPDETAEIATADLSKLSDALLNGLQMSLDPWAASGVTTVDIPAHLPWFGRGSDGKIYPAKEMYKPGMTTALRFNVLGQFVRVLMWGRKLVSVPETAAYLIAVGQPSLFASNAAKNAVSGNAATRLGPIRTQAELAHWVSTQVLADVGKPSGPVPIPEHVDDPFQRVLQIVTIQDLGAGYAYDYDPTYMHRLQSLGPVALPFLLESAREFPHTLVRRNAIAMLENFHSPATTQLFRDILEDNDDRVMQMRALMALVRRHDVDSAEEILRQLPRTRSLSWASSLVWALGALGKNPQAEAAVVKWLQEGMKSARREEKRDYMWSGLAALARMGASSNDAKKIYRAAMEGHTSGDPMYQLGLLGYAASGDRNAVKVLKRFIDNRHLLAFVPGASSVATEVLNRLAPTLKKNYLHDAIDDTRVHSLIRYHAIRVADFGPEDGKMLEEWARKSNLVVIRAGALLHLWKQHRPRALAVAQTILNEYVSGKRQDAYEALFALRLQITAGTWNHDQALNVAKTCYQIESRRRSSGGVGIGGKLLHLPVPLLETALPYLGRKPEGDTLTFLIQLLTDKKMGLQALAARSLRRAKGKKVSAALIEAMQSDDPWLRYWAADSLQSSSGRNDETHWFFAEKKERKDAIKVWQDWHTNK